MKRVFWNRSPMVASFIGLSWDDVAGVRLLVGMVSDVGCSWRPAVDSRFETFIGCFCRSWMG